jgi:RND family efflux transporter MFP subunit
MRALTLTFALLSNLFVSAPIGAETLKIVPETILEWKAVYGRIEAKETVPARSRLGGLVVELLVSEGDLVTSGQRIAMIRDDKIDFQIVSSDAQIEALQSQLTTAENELERGEALLERGVFTAQRLDQLRTTTDVLRGQINSMKAERDVLTQQAAEGEIVASEAGRILTVPVTLGAVVLSGEAVATIGGGGFFLRLAIPERHAGAMVEGTALRIAAEGEDLEGQIAKVYPQIENGRVIADVELAGIDTAFVNARVLVELPIGERKAILVPKSAVSTRSGIDFVTVRHMDSASARAVMLGDEITRDGATFTEVLTGLAPGDEVEVP